MKKFYDNGMDSGVQQKVACNTMGCMVMVSFGLVGLVAMGVAVIACIA